MHSATAFRFYSVKMGRVAVALGLVMAMMAVYFSSAPAAQAATYSDIVLGLNPAVYYTFDNVAGSVINEGSTGAANNGALSGGASITTSGGGQVGEAMSTALSQYLLVGSGGVDISASGWTTSAWFKGIYNNGDWRTLYRGSENDHQLIVEHGSRRLGIYDNTGTGFKPSGFDVSAIDGDGQWHHVTSRGNAGGDTDIFVDGVNVGTSSTRSPFNITWIGGCCGSSQTWGPLIDEVAIFQTPLSDAEIAQLANASPAPAGTPKVIQFNGGDGSGQPFYTEQGLKVSPAASNLSIFDQKLYANSGSPGHSASYTFTMDGAPFTVLSLDALPSSAPLRYGTNTYVSSAGGTVVNTTHSTTVTFPASGWTDIT